MDDRHLRVGTALLCALAMLIALVGLAPRTLPGGTQASTAAPLHLLASRWDGSSLSADGLKVGSVPVGLPTPSELVRAYEESALPPVVSNLSDSSPLVFYHQRKTGGSSLREALRTAAVAANLSIYMPCYNGVDCDTYTSGSARAAVYAGHLPWGDRRNLDRNGLLNVSSGMVTWHTPEQIASCLTMFREPISRLESCYYYRFIDAETAGLKAIADPRFQCMSNLTAPELRSMLSNGRTAYGFGCLAEPFRILSGMNSETELAELAGQPLESLAVTAMLEMTLRHLTRCIPLVLEEPATLALARHWFPQLAPAFAGALPRMNVRQNAEQRCLLAPHTRAILKELATAETVVYEAAQRRAAAMLASLPAEGQPHK